MGLIKTESLSQSCITANSHGDHDDVNVEMVPLEDRKASGGL